MAKQLNIDDAKLSLTAHVSAKGREIREKYGPNLGWEELQEILGDKEFVRYPCEIKFDAEPLRQGEFAHPIQKAGHPEEGFTMYVHPMFATQPHDLPYLVLYQLVLVNYGEFASSEDAETFGAAALGLPKEDFYRAVCRLADQIAK